MENQPDTRLQRLDRLAQLLDSSIRIPGIGYRIGYDAILGIIPGIGDAAGLVLSTYIVVEAARFHVPKSTLLRMVTNVAVEAIIGAIPIIGDVFDAVYKANLRNLRLLHRHLDDSESAPKEDRTFFATVVFVPIGAILLLAALIAWALTVIF